MRGGIGDGDYKRGDISDRKRPSVSAEIPIDTTDIVLSVTRREKLTREQAKLYVRAQTKSVRKRAFL